MISATHAEQRHEAENDHGDYGKVEPANHRRLRAHTGVAASEVEKGSESSSCQCGEEDRTCLIHCSERLIEGSSKAPRASSRLLTAPHGSLAARDQSTRTT